ncbi:MAG TPA: FlgD immunoglobulin-like domain containing protein [Nocardioidaceae bacterium]|nr:FlgD immunoglobulin-like domain containing protein [Nocardioidaceae bacterium]
MNRLLRLVLLALVATSAVVLPISPAQAYGGVTITAPTSNVNSGWGGPITFTFDSDAEVGDYSFEIDCENYDYDWDGYYYDGNPTSYTWHTSSIQGPTDCTINIEHYYGAGYASRTIHVNAPPPPKMNVSESSVSPATFYPRVRDGYKDATRISYRLNQRANVTATVRNSNGARVRTTSIGWQTGGYRAWSWNGRNDSGSAVRTGTYSVTIAATNRVGSKDSVARSVKVATGYTSKRVTRSRWGDDGRPATSGNCTVRRDDYEGAAYLDCWGGNYAQMTYSFRIPSNASNVRWNVAGGASSADICCDGTIKRTGYLASATRAIVRVRVTGWRAWDAHKASVTYTVRKRI